MDAAPPKMEKDLSGLVDVQLPETSALAKQGKLTAAIEQLLVLEKQTRVVRHFVLYGVCLVVEVEVATRTPPSTHQTSDSTPSKHTQRANQFTTKGLRPRVKLSSSRPNRPARFRRQELEAAQRTRRAPLKETRPTQAGYNQNDSTCNGSH